jgi:hypothetical protein
MSILFNGDCYFQSTLINLPTAQAAKSVLAKVNLGSLTALQTIFNAVNPTLGIGYQVGISAAGAFNIWSYGGGVLISATGLTLSSWLSLAYTFNGTTHTLYINGIAVATSTTATQTGAPSLIQIGGNQWNEYLRNTLVEDLRVYDRAITVEEAVSYHTEYFNDIYGLVAWWKCQEANNGIALPAANFIEEYGRTHTLVGTAPFPVSRENYQLNNVNPLGMLG